jgi:hypothetical protein
MKPTLKFAITSFSSFSFKAVKIMMTAAPINLKYRILFGKD